MPKSPLISLFGQKVWLFSIVIMEKSHSEIKPLISLKRPLVSYLRHIRYRLNVSSTFCKYYVTIMAGGGFNKARILNDLVGCRDAFFDLGNVPQGGFSDGFQGVGGEKSLVPRDKDVGEGQKPAEDV